MKSLGDIPSENHFPSPETMWMGTDEERMEKLKEISMLIANKFNRQSNVSTGDSAHDYSWHLITVGCTT